MIRADRIVKTRRADTAFDGEGARRAGGRWNSSGTRVVYLAKTIALAALEILVHLDDAGLRASYSFIPISFPVACVQTPGKKGVAVLPDGWADTPAPIECAQGQRLGSIWREFGAASAQRHRALGVQFFAQSGASRLEQSRDWRNAKFRFRPAFSALDGRRDGV